MVAGMSSWIALAVALVCGVLLVRLLLGPARRARFDRFWRDRVGLAGWRRARGAVHGVRRLVRRRADQQAAAKAAEEVINRARRARPRVDKAGNVYTPHSFKGPRKPH
ncbi:hypothetical protein [uncultured Aquabacterium sp.]|uniref:hypothetical protein n=1 Tax=Aquabacterium sp. TaxID=1872578 RepID=UPI0025CE0C32|nr:hypothetical protein [uncultured Aquabacterium sp.]